MRSSVRSRKKRSIMFSQEAEGAYLSGHTYNAPAICRRLDSTGTYDYAPGISLANNGCRSRSGGILADRSRCDS